MTADLIATYGTGVLQMGMELQYALWLHLPRIRHQKAVAVLLGVAGGNSSKPLARAFFDAIARDEGEVDALEFNTNASRQEAEVLSKYGIDP